MTPTITPLEACASLIPRLARWYHLAWADIEGLSLATLEEELVRHLPGDGRLGRTWVALDGDDPVGTVSLDESDLPGHTHLGPWLASLYVVPSSRGGGLGRRLVEHVADEACRTGIADLYLWTAGAGRLYLATGFEPVARTRYGSHPITVMRRACAGTREPGPALSAGPGQGRAAPG